MAVKVKMLSDRRNLNAMRVTAGFINAIVADPRYIGTPLVVDKLRLEAGQYSRLTHLQDERTGAFGSQQIGSFVSFEVMQESDGENVLVGTARIEKRFDRACAAIQQLYEMDRLRVSFEITAATYTQTAEEIIIDAAEGNQLIGMCIVSIPAYEDAKALALVASMTAEPTTSYPPYLMHTPWIPGSTPIQVELIQSAAPVTTPVPVQEQPVEVPQPDPTPMQEPTPEPAVEAPLQSPNPEERNEVMADIEKTLPTAAAKPEEDKPEEETPEEEKKPDTKKAEAADAVIAALKAEVEALKASNAQLAEIKVKWEQAEAAALKAEEDKKREGLRQLLASHQLKAENHQAAIDALDYAAVIAACNAAPVQAADPKPVVAATAAANGLVQMNGVQMAGNKADHPYHKLVKDLTL